MLAWTPLLYEVAQALESPDDPETRVDLVLGLLCRCVGADRCVLLEASPSLTRTISIEPADEPASQRAAIAQRAQALLALLQAHAPVERSNAVGERGNGARAHLAVPIFSLGAVIALLMVERDEADFDESHLGLMSVIAAQLGAYLGALRSADELRTLADNSPDLIARFDRSLRCVFVNRAIEAAMGLPRTALIGRTSAEIGSPATLFATWEAALREAFETGLARTHESDCATGFGTRIYESRLVPERTATGEVRHVLVVARDRTHALEVEHALRLAQARFQTALRAAPIMLFNHDASMRYTWAHGPAHGLDPAAFIGRVDAELFEPEQAQVLTRLKSDSLAGGRGLRAEVVMTLAGQRRTCDLTVEPLRDEGGAVNGLACAAVDITDRLVAEARLREADRHKDEFLAMLGHELRNPLAPIVNALRLLERTESFTERGRDALTMMERQARQLQRLVDDLLEASRIREGKVELRMDIVDVAAVIHHATEAVASECERRRQRLLTRLPPEPIRVHADPMRLAQVLENLLHNACKYTPDGGEIRVEADSDEKDVAIRVVDDGIGIDPAKHASIFDLFSQVDRAGERSQGGLGIGLALVKRLAELHGGNVSVASEGAGKGSTFTVTLPRGIR